MAPSIPIESQSSLNRIILPADGNLTGSLDQSGPGSNENGKVLHIP